MSKNAIVPLLLTAAFGAVLGCLTGSGKLPCKEVANNKTERTIPFTLQFD